MALQRLDVAVVKVRLRRAEGLAVAGDEADGLDPLLERAQRRIGQPGGVGGVLHQHLAVAGLQHGGIVGADADVARQPGLLVEIDGAEREQRMAVRGDGDQLLGGQRVDVAGIVEIGQRQWRAQIADDGRELRRRRVAALAADVEMHVVAEQRDVGGDHDRNRGAGHEYGRYPGGEPRAAAAQRQAKRQREQREQRQRPGGEQEAVRGVFAEAGEAERAERDRADDEDRYDDVGSSGHARFSLSAARARARSATASSSVMLRKNPTSDR